MTKASKSNKSKPSTTTDPKKSKEEAKALADATLRPSVNAAVVIDVYSKPFGEQDLPTLMEALSTDMKRVSSGDMERVESMLYGQAQALQSIFMNLARRAANQEYLKQWEAYMRMALKAQGQCRMTLETLATIKNPPVVIARQANINNGGQQQVNNGGPAAPAPGPAHIAQAHPHATNSSTEQNELLEASHGERLDTRTTSPTSSANQELATVEAVNRPKD